ncbi:MAG: hypothetical protein D3915_08685 [Candidatus Electrothrix sp. AU1_5]|jgi:hypothetical protein|nr:hypothetical protein [Candidatus Electrothrix gigas]MCI5190833.1 hypothetical protein [Candidatus Electrothrix gigas]MCI5193194.1 hypothetical protein [Candidatus Electrothrix gigas]
MSQHTLDILRRLTTDSSLRQTRLPELLKPAEATYAESWFMYVGKCFNDPLDIRLTERIVDGEKSRIWTQGSAFSFREGDTLYDTRDAYQEWAKAMKSISLCVQVKQAMPAGSIDADGGKRSPGSVTIDIFKPNEGRTKLVSYGHYTMSQDSFVHFLISGPSGDFAARLKEQSSTIASI